MTRTRTAAGTGVVAILALLLVATTVAPAAASGEAHRAGKVPAQARFEGRHIDLTRGWGDATTCVVWDRDGETDCFRTKQAADAAVARHDRAAARRAALASRTLSPMVLVADRRWHDAPAVVPLLASSCSDWLTLYEHSSFAGRSLRFQDRGYHQDLASWGFANQTSSYRVGSCPVDLRDSGWADYPGWTGANASATHMATGWNDRVRYLRVN